MQHLPCRLIYPLPEPRAPARFPLPVLGSLGDPLAGKWAPLWGRCARRGTHPTALRWAGIGESQAGSLLAASGLCSLPFLPWTPSSKGLGAGGLPSFWHTQLCHPPGPLLAADQVRQPQSMPRQLGNPGQGGALVGFHLQRERRGDFACDIFPGQNQPGTKECPDLLRGWKKQLSLDSWVILGTRLRPPEIQWLGSGCGRVGSPFPQPPGQQSCQASHQEAQKGCGCIGRSDSTGKTHFQPQIEFLTWNKQAFLGCPEQGWG